MELYAGTARSADAFRAWRRAKIGLLADHDEFARDTYLANYPDAPYVRRDVSRLSPDRITTLVGGRVDILLGCPPCQGFSDTGLRDPTDRRNAHLTRFANVAAALRPLAVAMENVPLAGGTERFAAFVDHMECLGYRSTWGVVNAALHGSAQCRHRLMYVGIRRDVGETPRFPRPTHGVGTYWSYRHGRLMTVSEDRVSMLSESPSVRRVRGDFPHDETTLPLGARSIPTLGELWSGLPRLSTAAARNHGHYAWEHTSAMRRRMGRVPEGGKWAGGADHFSHSYGRLHRRGLAHTLTTFFSNPGSGRFWHPTHERAISLREAARVQGFPDDFQFSPDAMASCRLIGNALDARLADITYRVVRECLS